MWTNKKWKEGNNLIMKKKTERKKERKEERKEKKTEKQE